MKDVKQLQYLGAEKASGLDCDHMRITHGDFVRDLWVTKSKAPMLLKVEPNMVAGLSEKARKAGNKIFLSFTYKDQILGKSMNDGRFEVAHPPSAKYVREFFHEEGAELIGKKAPDVTLPMADGTKIKLSSLKDRLVVLDFWATWCPPCVMSLPIFAKASQPFKSKGVVFIAVNKGESLQTAKDYLRTNHIDATLAADQDGRVGSAFNVEGIPCTIFIGRDGFIKGVHVGIRPTGLAEGFTEDLNKFIAGKSLKREQ
jgi:thiol-disulfide isomerase/thioredoxin